MARRWSLLGLAAAAGCLLAGAAAAQQAGPYDMRYQTRAETTLTAAIDKGSKTVVAVPAGEGGIVLRWCRPEIPFGTWQYGSAATWRRLLDERRCEVGWKGHVGFVDGTALAPAK